MLPFSDDRNIRLSWFAHIFKREDVIAIVHSLTSISVFFDPLLLPIVESLWTPKTWKQIQSNLVEPPMSSIVEDMIQQLTEAKMVVPAEYSEEKYLNEVRQAVLVGPHFDILFLLLTEACNLRCTYCFIEGSKPEGYKNDMMSAQTVRAAIDAFIRWKAPEGEKSVVFYGGEPLLNLDTFMEALRYLDYQVAQGKLSENLDRILITNGVLITENLVELFVQHKVFPYISIDGPPELHNRQRPYATGRGSFEDAVRGLELVRSVGIEPGISVTATEEMLPDLHNILEWLAVNLRVSSVGFNMLEAIPGRNYFSDQYGTHFAEALLRCQTICDRYNLYEERVMRKAKQFAKREIYIFDCAACGEQLTIAPNGQVGVCQGFVGTRDFFSGNVHDTDYDPNKDPIFIDWSSVTPLNNPDCFRCPGLGICGGGCPRNPFIEGKGIHGVDTRFCAHVLETQKWLIFRLYDRLESK